MRLSMLYEMSPRILFEATPVPQGGPQYGIGQGQRFEVAGAPDLNAEAANPMNRELASFAGSPDMGLKFWKWDSALRSVPWWQGPIREWFFTNVFQGDGSNAPGAPERTYRGMVTDLNQALIATGQAAQPVQPAPAQPAQPAQQWQTTPMPMQPGGTSVRVIKPDGQHQSLVVPMGQDEQAYIQHMIQTGYLPAGTRVG